MIFKPGDKVLVNGTGPYEVYRSTSSTYPLKVNERTYTLDGRSLTSGPFELEPFYPESVTNYSLGKVQTLDNGIQIYHPDNGQPFQLIIPTTKALL